MAAATGSWSPTISVAIAVEVLAVGLHGVRRGFSRAETEAKDAAIITDRARRRAHNIQRIHGSLVTVSEWIRVPCAAREAIAATAALPFVLAAGRSRITTRNDAASRPWVKRPASPGKISPSCPWIWLATMTWAATLRRRCATQAAWAAKSSSQHCGGRPVPRINSSAIAPAVANGVDGLRIADASVMPDIVSVNPNATVVAIAESAAARILLAGYR
jgi:hypothetical protein